NKQLQSNINNMLAQMIQTNNQTSNETSTTELSSSSILAKYKISLQQLQKLANSAFTNKQVKRD
ncbi:3275_t:CDS:1, partial [Scutellospora calospora]